MPVQNNAAETDVILIDKIVHFINEIGIPCRQANLGDDTFLPGIDIKDGCVLYDTQLLKYPGDLLHDAGHVAVLSPADRQHATSPDNLNGDLEQGAAEMGAICWSWAAAKHLEIPPEVLFHKDGYKGGAESLINNFSNGSYIGLPILQWLGMTIDPVRGEEQGEHTYPKMKCWVRG